MTQQQLPVTFEPISPKTLPDLKTLNSVLFPIRYKGLQRAAWGHPAWCAPAAELCARPWRRVFCSQSPKSGVSWAGTAYSDGQLVGAIACRPEAQPDGSAKLYIMTLGVLAPYRGLGVGSRLVERVLAACACDSAFREAYLHVHTPNQEAIAFYQRRGFAARGVVTGYYQRLRPPDAMLLTRSLPQG